MNYGMKVALSAPISTTQAITPLHQSNYCSSQFIGSTSDTNKRSFNILLAEDDDVVSEKLITHFRELNLPVKIKICTSSQLAIEHVQNNPVDIIFIDHELTDMTDCDLLNELKSINTSYIPIIMIMGISDIKAVTRSENLRINDYLHKDTLTSELLLAVTNHAMHTIEMEDKLKEVQEKLKHLSLYDKLTHLPNRNLLFDRLSHAIAVMERTKHTFYLLMINLDLFKDINDTLGHSTGDHVLSVIGERLFSAIRKTDTPARLGGDEFVCILNDIDDLEQIEAITSNIIDTISATINYENQILQVGASVGIVQCNRQGLNASTLLSNADSAMYEAKKSKRRYVIHKENNIRSTQKTLPVANDIYDAIQNNELYMVYQSQTCLSTNKIIGAEALIRWKSKKFGQVAPTDFLLCAERTSLIKYITYTTFGMAIESIKKWKQAGVNIPVSINLSARMLDDTSFPGWLFEIMNTQGIMPSDLNIEITETALASSSDNITNILSKLISAGYKISIDDFGSGYSSLQFISKFNFSELKIDKCFIDNITTDHRSIAITQSIIQLAKSLNMSVIAEGVETQEQVTSINKLGCDNAQGYFFGKPVTPDVLTKLCLAEKSTE